MSDSLIEVLLQCIQERDRLAKTGVEGEANGWRANTPGGTGGGWRKTTQKTKNGEAARRRSDEATTRGAFAVRSDRGRRRAAEQISQRRSRRFFHVGSIAERKRGGESQEQPPGVVSCVRLEIVEEALCGGGLDSADLERFFCRPHLSRRVIPGPVPGNPLERRGKS
jgi:hypothetical protein